jgi:hypothetical protein
MGLAERAVEAWERKKAADAAAERAERERWEAVQRAERIEAAKLIATWFTVELDAIVEVDISGMEPCRFGHRVTVFADGLVFQVTVERHGGRTILIVEHGGASVFSDEYTGTPLRASLGTPLERLGQALAAKAKV